MSKFESNVDLFRELNVPFESQDHANEALRGFLDDVRAAREKHKIANVCTIVQIDMKTESGIVPGFSSGFLGDLTMQLPIAARYYGQCQAEHRQIIDRALSQGLKIGREE